MRVINLLPPVGKLHIPCPLIELTASHYFLPVWTFPPLLVDQFVGSMGFRWLVLESELLKIKILKIFTSTHYTLLFGAFLTCMIRTFTFYFFQISCITHIKYMYETNPEYIWRTDVNSLVIMKWFIWIMSTKYASIIMRRRLMIGYTIIFYLIKKPKQTETNNKCFIEQKINWFKGAN